MIVHGAVFLFARKQPRNTDQEVLFMPKELAKQYAPQGAEDRIYQNWCDKGYFHTQIDRSKKPFTIVMPPPNVTGPSCTWAMPWMRPGRIS